MQTTIEQASKLGTVYEASEPPKIRVLAYDSLCTFEYGIAVEIFAPKRADCERHLFDLATVAEERGPMRAAGGLTIKASHGLDSLNDADVIIIPGWKSRHTRPSRKLLDALIDAHDQGARLLSICSGVFVLAATGLLNQKSATTHWRYVEQLEQEYPQISIEPNVLYVDEGSILTSAGSTAGIDACLHVVRDYYGQTTANKIAKSLVVPSQRDGGQAQFIPNSISTPPNSAFNALLEEIRSDVSKEWTVATMAQKANVSQRTLLRRFKQQLGESPNAWITRERLVQASELLENSNMKIDQIAFQAGFGAPETFRLHFKKRYNISPARYRSQFNMR